MYINTKNVDDLHECPRSKNVLHLHSELLKVRSTKNSATILDWRKDLTLGDIFKKKKNQLRPIIIRFGEKIPELDKAIEITKKADILVIIATSMQVYPATSLVLYVQPKNLFIL